MSSIMGAAGCDIHFRPHHFFYSIKIVFIKSWRFNNFRKKIQYL